MLHTTYVNRLTAIRVRKDLQITESCLQCTTHRPPCLTELSAAELNTMTEAIVQKDISSQCEDMKRWKGFSIFTPSLCSLFQVLLILTPYNLCFISHFNLSGFRSQPLVLVITFLH